MNDEKNSILYQKYRTLAEQEKQVAFGGRLGEYKYYDMDQVIAAALRKAAEGEQTSQWMKSFIQGKKVSLEYDEELNDRYGRTLAYVYVDGVLLEDILLREGMARTLIMEPNTRYQHHFEQIEKEARESEAGFWGTGFFRDKRE